MLKKEIEYRNMDGLTVKETLYFDLSPEEFIELKARNAGAFAVADKLQNEGYQPSDQEAQEMLAGFRDVIVSAYGERVKDEHGRDMFIKNDKVHTDFQNRFAYRALMVELYDENNAELLQNFMQEVLK